MDYGLPWELLTPPNDAEQHFHSANISGVASEAVTLMDMEPGEVWVLRYAQISCAFRPSGTMSMQYRLDLLRGASGTDAQRSLMNIWLIGLAGTVPSEVATMEAPLVIHGGELGNEIILRQVLVGAAPDQSRISCVARMWPLSHPM